jgi:hypothetical protein
MLPERPEPEGGLAELKALVEASGSWTDLRLALSSSPPEGADEPYTRVSLEGGARFADIRALVDRLRRARRVIDIGRLELSGAGRNRVHVTAVARLHFLAPSPEPEAQEGRAELERRVARVRDVRSESQQLERFLGAVELAARSSVVFERAMFEQDQGAVRAHVEGRVSWPYDVGAGTSALSNAGFTVSRHEREQDGPCHAFVVEVSGRSSGTAENPDPSAAPFTSSQELCHVNRDLEGPRLVLRAAGKGPLTLRLREVDLADVLKLLHEQTLQGFVVDEDVRGRVTVDFRDVTLEEALASLRPAGVAVSAPAPLRRVSLATHGLPRSPRSGAHGHKVTLNFKRAPIATVLAIFQEIRERGVWAPAGLGGRISVFAAERPWDELYAAILDGAGLSSRDEPTRTVIEGAPGPLQPVASLPAWPHAPPAAEVVLKPEEFPLAGIVSADGGWTACTYDPMGRLWTMRSGQQLWDARRSRSLPRRHGARAPSSPTAPSTTPPCSTRVLERASRPTTTPPPSSSSHWD